jgi:hypothetical protein
VIKAKITIFASMVKPLLGDPEVLQQLLSKVLGSRAEGLFWAQLVSFKDPLLFDREVGDLSRMLGAVVCLPEKVLVPKRGGTHLDTQLKWTAQAIPNTCGTVAVFNLCQNLFHVDQTLSVQELHTEIVAADEETEASKEADMHFVAIMLDEGGLIEIDGRNPYGFRKLMGRNLIEAIEAEYLSSSQGNMSAFCLFKQ